MDLPYHPKTAMVDFFTLTLPAFPGTLKIPSSFKAEKSRYRKTYGSICQMYDQVKCNISDRYIGKYSRPTVAHNCHGKTKSHGTINLTHGKTVLSDGKTKLIHGSTQLIHGKTKLTHGSTQLIHGKTKLTHGRTPLTHGKTKFTHGKTKKTSWSAVGQRLLFKWYVV